MHWLRCPERCSHAAFWRKRACETLRLPLRILQNTWIGKDLQERGSPGVASGDKRQWNLTSQCQCELRCSPRAESRAKVLSAFCLVLQILPPHFPPCSRPRGLRRMSKRTKLPCLLAYGGIRPMRGTNGSATLTPLPESGHDC